MGQAAAGKFQDILRPYISRNVHGEGQGRIPDPGVRASKCDERSGKRRNLRGIHVTSQSEMAPRGGSWAGPPEAKPILYTPADGPWRACERRPRATMAGAAPAEVSHGQPVHLSARAREKRSRGLDGGHRGSPCGGIQPQVGRLLQAAGGGLSHFCGMALHGSSQRAGSISIWHGQSPRPWPLMMGVNCRAQLGSTGAGSTSARAARKSLHRPWFP